MATVTPLNLLDQRGPISDFLAMVEQMREGVDEETAGWVIRRPSFFDFGEHFGILFARSKVGSKEPLELPQGIEVCIAVTEGAVSVEGVVGDILPNRFFVVGPRDSRKLYSVHHPTKLACIFFQGAGDGRALDSRQAA